MIKNDDDRNPSPDNEHANDEDVSPIRFNDSNNVANKRDIWESLIQAIVEDNYEIESR